MEQAELQFKVGTVLQRRDRFELAVERYRQSLTLYGQVEESELHQAACHHRIADLYHHELQDSGQARIHYRRAIALYAEHEPPSEGEQMNRVLCEWHLQEIERAAGRNAER
jgi:tetratricopeptide (TPR) repeat protein